MKSIQLTIGIDSFKELIQKAQGEIHNRISAAKEWNDVEEIDLQNGDTVYRYRCSKEFTPEINVAATVFVVVQQQRMTQIRPDGGATMAFLEKHIERPQGNGKLVEHRIFLFLGERQRQGITKFTKLIEPVDA